ncbi:MAG: hypothetical protein ACK4XJ_09705 [Fimbriimonadaceae bacterium]
MRRTSALFLGGAMLAGLAQAQGNEPGVFLMNETFGNPNSGKVFRMNLLDRVEIEFGYDREDVDPSFTAVGAGDFNLDGWADGVFMVNGNTIMIVYHQDNNILGALSVDTDLEPGQKVVGVGEFNGIGPSDILVQDSQFNLSVWIMGGFAGTELQSVVALGKSTINGTDRYCGFADVDGDGLADVILNRTKKDLVYWDSTGTDVSRNGEGNPLRFTLMTLASKGRQQGYGKTTIIGAADTDNGGSLDLIARENKGADRYSV